MYTYIYDSLGAWIAFIPAENSRYLFAPDGRWIGWFPWFDDRAVTRDGRYLGTVVGDRLLRQRADASLPSKPSYPGSPTFPRIPRRPARAARSDRAFGYSDVPSEMLSMVPSGRPSLPAHIA